jgi:hypothetical protein
MIEGPGRLHYNHAPAVVFTLNQDGCSIAASCTLEEGESKCVDR